VVSLTSFIGVDGTNTTLNSGRFLINLKPHDTRSSTVLEVIRRLGRETANLPGTRLYLQPVQDLTIDTTVSRAQYQFTLESPDPVLLQTWTAKLVDRLGQDPKLVDVASDSQENGLSAFIEVDRDTDRFTVRSCAHRVLELQIGILDRIESLAIAGVVRVSERHANFLRRGVHLAFAGLGNRRPLARRGLEPHVAVRGDALVVHDDAEATLVTFGVVVLPVHHIDAGPLEVFLGVEFEIVGRESSSLAQKLNDSQEHESTH